ncbi:MAG: redoxin domain-containing protein [Campylobacterota bacterium]|nr:redoxin domain-containing protein [Campylobacterota bacterium]
MKEKIKHYIKEILLFFIVMTIFANMLSFYKSQDLLKQPLDINYELKVDKPILIHFWATWCPTCKVEASNIQAISSDYEVLTIVVKSGSNKEIRDYMEDEELNFRFINDNDGYFAQKFNISAYPTTLIYDKDKNLVFSDVGYTSTVGLYLRMWWAGI